MKRKSKLHLEMLTNFHPLNKLLSLFGAGLALASVGHAQIAADDAANYVTWSNGSNGGSGFLPWEIETSGGGFAGTFLGSSTDGAGDINTGGSAFGFFANPGGAAVNANRVFSAALTAGQTFTFDLALNFDNGNKGFDLIAGSQGKIFNFNVGSGGSVSSENATLNPGAGEGYNYGGNNAVISVVFEIVTASSMSYEISRASGQGSQGTLFSGTVTGLTEGVSEFGLYVSGTENGVAANNLYANSFVVVPEPGTYLAMGFAALLVAFVARRRREA